MSVFQITHIFNESGNESFLVADISMFVNEGMITASTLILTKFVKMQCEYSEVSKKVIEHLWSIMKHVKDQGSSDLEVLDECFIYILRKRPQCLFLIDDGNDCC